jgi:hypothetical protein
MRWGATALTVGALVSALAVGACGEEEVRFSDGKIVEKLNLEKVEGSSDYSMEDDPFCVVAGEFLNTAQEVEAARNDEKTRELTVTSREGNVGIVGLPTFASDCQEKVQKKLSRLDVPADDG